MLFMIYGVDKPGHGEVRAANRAAHLDYLKSQGDKVVVGGPTTSDDGQAMTGSLLIMDFAGRPEVEAFAAGDPYKQAGLFESVTIRAWKKVLPAGQD